MQFAALNPNDAVARRALGLLMRDMGKPMAAKAWLHEAVELGPSYAEAWMDLGQAHEALGENTQAQQAYARAASLAPGYEEALMRLAAFGFQTGAPDVFAWPPPRPLPAGDRDLAFDIPGNAAAEEQAVRSALTADPADQRNLLKLIMLLLAQNRAREAELFARHILAADPGGVQAGLALMSVMQMHGLAEAAMKQALTVLGHAPEHPVAAVLAFLACLDGCQWTRFAERKDRARAALQAYPHTAEPMEAPHLGLNAAEIAAVARTFAARLATEPKAVLFPRLSKSKITVGYFSADFHDHPVGRIAAEIFECHDRERFDIKCYSLWPAEDDVRRRIVNACGDVAYLYGSGAADAASKIAQDGVDILVDLTGYSRNYRADILALKPAPIQVNYLGYPGTMSAPFMDYMIADTFVAADPAQLNASEKIVRLPGSLLPAFGYRAALPAAMSRKNFGLPDDAVVLCNFGETRRLTPDVFAVWMRILKQVPNAVLWLSAPREEAITRLKIFAVEHGVGAHRLIFAPRAPVGEYLARYAVADLFLDTMPVNAQSTAGDALWMGCPVLTVIGQTYPSRVAASLLQAVMCSELATPDIDRYEQKAVEWAKDADLRGSFRAKIKQLRQVNAIFNPPAFTRTLERAYVKMWEKQTKGEPPESFDV